MKKRAFFIIGPESSGTRMLTKAFVSLGMYGDGGHGQRLDKEGFTGRHEQLAFRRSVPHGPKMPRIAELVRKMQRAGYNVHPIVILRDKDMCAQSQVKNHHQPNVESAKASIQKAIQHIYQQLAQVGKAPVVVHYEPFVKFKKVRKALFAKWKLPLPKINFYDGNEKYDTTGQTS